MGWKDSKSQGIREFSERLCILLEEKATTSIKFHHDCQNMNEDDINTHVEVVKEKSMRLLQPYTMN